MAAPHPTVARFASLPPEAGHYESFYLKACHPGGGLGVWIRYTVHKRPGAEPTGSLWFTLFDAGAEGPRAAKLTQPGPLSDGAEWLRVGDASIGSGFARGSVEGVAWDLRFSSSEAPLFHLPRDWMYRARLPRTKLLSPLPAASFEGSVLVDGRSIAVEGWRGMVGHNWGVQHAERWIWLHGIDAAGDWLDAAIGRVRLGPVSTPWIANGVVSLGGVRYVLGGPGRRVSVDERPERCTFAFGGPDVRVRGEVSAPLRDVVGWVYADPDGGEHHTANCSIADLRLDVSGSASASLVVPGGAAYELGMRERDHGVPIQPYPDG